MSIRISAVAGAGFTSLGDTYVVSPTDQVNFLKELEAMGLLRMVATGDATENGIYANLAFAGTATSQAIVGPTMSNPVTRWPTVTAGEVAAINWQTEGRAFLALGGGRGVSMEAFRQMGALNATLDQIREYTLAVKALWAGEEAEYQGQRLQFWNDIPKADIPVYLDASGPKSMALCGEVADGAMTAYGIDEASSAYVRAQVAEGAALAGRNAEDIEVMHLQPAMLAPTVEEAKEKIRFYLAMRTRAIFSRPETKGVPEHLHDPIREFRARYVKTSHGNHTASDNADLLDHLGLTDWAFERQAIAGPPEAFAERLNQLASWGVRNVLFALWGATNEERLANARVIADEVLPRLA